MHGNWMGLSRVNTWRVSNKTSISNGLGIQLVKSKEGPLTDTPLIVCFFFHSGIDLISCSEDQSLGNDLQQPNS